MFCLAALSLMASGQSLWLKAWLLGSGPADLWESTSHELRPEQCCGVQGGRVRTDGLQDECVCGCGLPIQVHHCSYHGVAVANTELPIHVSTCGQKTMKLQTGNSSWPGKGRWCPTLLPPWDSPGGPATKGWAAYSALPKNGDCGGSDEGVAVGQGAECLKS